MNLDLRRLSHVVAVGRHRSFSRAAIDLGITQPALSRSIAAFEANVGGRLFDRDRVSVIPTAMGARVIEDAERLLSQARILDHNMRQWSRAETGSIAFGIGPLPASILLSDLLSSLANSHPKLVIDARVAPAEQLLPRLGEDDLEMVICSQNFVTDAALSSQPLFNAPIGLFVRAAHPLAGRLEVQPADLHAHPLASSRFVSHQEHVFDGDGSPTIICDDYAVLKRLMLATDVIWLGSSRLLERELAEGVVAQLSMNTAADLSRTTIVAAWRANRIRSPAANLLLARLADILST